ncbi:hypothetical protein D3C84_952490 [compost metagenome]
MHEGVVAQVLEAQAGLGGEGMVSGQQGDHLIFHQHERIETLLGQHHETDVDPPFVQPLEDLPVGAFVDMHFDAGMQGSIAPQDTGQQFHR